jgi:DNA-binding Lrp family transcriptional regulator
MDGRIAAVELADKIGLSPTSTGERLKRLQREGYVAGSGARLDPHKLDLGFLVFVEVLLDKTTRTSSNGLPNRSDGRPRCSNATWSPAGSTIW